MPRVLAPSRRHLIPLGGFYSSEAIDEVIASVRPVKMPSTRVLLPAVVEGLGRPRRRALDRRAALATLLETDATHLNLARNSADEPTAEMVAASLQSLHNALVRARTALKMDRWSVDRLPIAVRAALVLQAANEDAKCNFGYGRSVMEPAAGVVASTLNAVARLERSAARAAAEVRAKSPPMSPETRPPDIAMNAWIVALAETFEMVFNTKANPGGGEGVPGPFVRFVVAASRGLGMDMNPAKARSRIQRAFDRRK